MKNMTITIGRNVKHIPMHRRQWKAFVVDVIGVFKFVEILPCNTFIFGGINEYKSIDSSTVNEQSFIINGIHEHHINHFNVKQKLKVLARKYKQETIAVSFGESELVGI